MLVVSNRGRSRINICNGSQVDHEYNIGNPNDINDPIQLGRVCSIRLPSIEGNVVFHVMRTMLQLLQMKVFHEGLENEDVHDHVRTSWTFVVCSHSSTYHKNQLVPMLFNGRKYKIVE